MIALLLLACAAPGERGTKTTDSEADTREPSTADGDTSIDTSDTPVDTDDPWAQDEPHGAGVLSGGALWRSGQHHYAISLLPVRCCWPSTH